MKTVMRQVPKNLKIEQYDGITEEMKESLVELQYKCSFPKMTTF